MNTQKLIKSLDRFRSVLPALVADLDDEDCRWRPPSGNWSILEIVCHLVDEEVEDFRTRVALTLEDPHQPWPAIDPEGVAIECKYNQSNFIETVERLVEERAKSIAFLNSLQNPDWGSAYEHPKFGPIQAGDVLAAWTAHDHLHVRQIAKRLYEMSARDSAPFGIRYAGDWTA